MDFTVKENSSNGTVVGTVPANSVVRLLAGDRNNNLIPAFTVGADNVIRVTDAAELDYELLFTNRVYQLLIARNGPDEIVSIRIEDEASESFQGTNGDDTLFSGWGRATLLGFSGNDQLRGTFERDTLIGGLGTDILTGGEEADHFVFDAPLQSGVDTITDFVNGGREFDRIVLDNDVFTKLRTKPLSFESVQGGRATKTSRSLIIYNSQSGGLFYNSNGSRNGFGGAGGLFAQLPKGLFLTLEVFLVQD